MSDVAWFLGVVVSVTGSLYCLMLLRDYRRQIRSLEATPSPGSTRGKSVGATFCCLGQILLAATFLTLALVLLAGFAHRADSLLWEESPIDRPAQRSFETLSIPGYPPIMIHYGSVQPGSPVVGIECHSKLISDDHVQGLLHVAPTLFWLNLAGTGISDNALSDLACVPGLSQLNLAGTRVGDVGLQHFVELKSLKSLHLDDTALTDNGVEWLGQLDKLELLELENTAVTQEGIDRLKGMLPDVEIRYSQGNRN